MDPKGAAMGNLLLGTQPARRHNAGHNSIYQNWYDEHSGFTNKSWPRALRVYRHDVSARRSMRDAGTR